LRKDAAHRRDRIIESAASLFRELGYNVPLDDIAAMAGVGRGTLYRNFADRQELALAVLDQELRKFEQFSESVTNEPEGLFRVIRALANITVVNSQLGREVRLNAAVDPLVGLMARKDRAVEEPLRRAKTAGMIRADFSVDDVSRAARMIAAPAEFLLASEREAAVDASFTLLLEGMRPAENLSSNRG